LVDLTATEEERYWSLVLLNVLDLMDYWS
jgi:hypothetical protein